MATKPARAVSPTYRQFAGNVADKHHTLLPAHRSYQFRPQRRIVVPSAAAPAMPAKDGPSSRYFVDECGIIITRSGLVARLDTGLF
jgi:hypothetical protein